MTTASDEIRDAKLVYTKSSGEKTLDQYKILELNADFRPIHYYPLSLMTWKDIMFLLVKGETTGKQRIQVVEEYDDVVVRTPHRDIKLPSVVAHMKFLKPPKKVPFNKFNVFLRDDFTCQYTGEKCRPEDLSFDHVIPEGQGGKTTWENIATATTEINQLKACRTPKEAGLHLKRKPYEPTYGELLTKGKKYPPRYLHDTWADYLYWDAELGD
jgi:5-methylcytosine-specific restriction endonuclease McrA